MSLNEAMSMSVTVWVSLSTSMTMSFIFIPSDSVIVHISVKYRLVCEFQFGYDSVREYQYEEDFQGESR